MGTWEKVPDTPSLGAFSSCSLSPSLTRLNQTQKSGRAQPFAEHILSVPVANTLSLNLEEDALCP